MTKHMTAVNVYTGEVARIHVTPINGAHVVKVDGKTTEMHRGNALTAERYINNLTRDGIWEVK